MAPIIAQDEAQRNRMRDFFLAAKGLAKDGVGVEHLLPLLNSGT